MKSKLKSIRVWVAILFFSSFLLSFLDFNEFFSAGSIHNVGRIQIFPAFVAALTGAGSAFFILFILTTLSLIFGRLYCSVICPLGIYMDFVSRLHRLLKRRHRYSYYPKPTFMHLGILGIVILAVIIDLPVFASFLDPFSIFGKIISGMVRPIVIFLYNFFSLMLIKMDYFFLKPVEFKGILFSFWSFSFAFFFMITAITLWRGRYFCNSICPVGSFLKVVSRWSVVRIRFDSSQCTSCGMCSQSCKAGCIDYNHQRVEYDSCIVCFNCLSSCPQDAIVFSGKRPERKSKITKTKISKSRRKFLSLLSIASLTVFQNAQAQSKKIIVYVFNKIKIHRKNPITPPGSRDLHHFLSTCISCYLCVDNCPGQVLQPSLFQYGATGILVPHLNNRMGFCSYKCNRCGEVCPTGAIKPLPLKTKQLTQLGVAKFIRDNCIVVLQKSECGACSEHCPTKAVQMIPEKNLHIPQVTPSLCIGCGACEFACPSLPYKSIYVEGNEFHRLARIPSEKKLKEADPTEDFPF